MSRKPNPVPVEHRIAPEIIRGREVLAIARVLGTKKKEGEE